MCLSKVYFDVAGKKEEVMEDVAHLEAKEDGVLLVGLLGEEKFVKGRLKSVDFVPEHTVVLEKTQVTL